MTNTVQLDARDRRVRPGRRRIRATPTGDVDLLADRLHWAMSRLVNHGWTVEQFSLDGWSVRDAAGQQHTVPAASADHSAPVLEVHVAHLLGGLAHLDPVDAETVLRLVETRLRLHMPARKAHPDDARQPWLLPSVVDAQPSVEVRRAYWSALTLTDDYGWLITDVHAEGFEAVTPGADTPTSFRRRRRNTGTTADTLAHLLPELSDHLTELTALVSAHQATTRPTRMPMGDPR